MRFTRLKRSLDCLIGCLQCLAELIHRIHAVPPPCVLTLDDMVSLLHTTGELPEEPKRARAMFQISVLAYFAFCYA